MFGTIRILLVCTWNQSKVSTLICGIVKCIPGLSDRPVKSWSIYSKTRKMLPLNLLLSPDLPLSSFSGPECNKTKLDQDLSLWRPQEGLFFSSIKHHGSKCHPRLKPFDVTISFSLMTFSCWSFFRILISRIAVIGNPSFSLSMRTFFNATISPVAFSLAMYTCLQNRMSIGSSRAQKSQGRDTCHTRDWQEQSTERRRSFFYSKRRSPAHSLTAEGRTSRTQ